MRGTTVAAALLAAGVCAGLTATAGSSGPAPATTTAFTATATAAASGPNWPEFNQNPARTGVAAGSPAAGALSTAWTARLDGAVYGQPLVVGHEVIAATENDSLYALNRASGKLVWRKHVGTPVAQRDLHGCGDIFPLGITGTPAYDSGNGLVYAVAELAGYHHMLVGLDAATGAVKLHRYIDVATVANQRAYNQQRPALTLAHGRVYVAMGGLDGDCGPYQGSVVSAPVTGNGP
ncbi:MAG TPA: PQQ-binding-like beta-propeller repeat protein, partial [Trebonia sp.]|nr:PQQ-binding-like beta-propeller repeat protein [Trebonia sp.]